MNFDYDRYDLRKSLIELGLKKGDVVFTHNNLGFFGRPKDIKHKDNLCSLFFEEIFHVIGETGTLAVPTFTYSFPKKEVFDVQETPSQMGIFSEWVRKNIDSIRSEDPCYSISAIGLKAKELTKDTPENSFGKNSFFEKFHNLNGVIVNMNFDAGSTFIHYVERELRVNYRFDKSFNGLIKRGNLTYETISTIWVRYMSNDCLILNTKSFTEVALDKKYFKKKALGKGQIGLISAKNTYSCIQETIDYRPWFLTHAEGQYIDILRLKELEIGI